MTAKLVTDDGWCVEAINLSGRQVLRVTRHGTMVRPPTAVLYDPKAEFTTVDQVRAVMGASFDRLREASL